MSILAARDRWITPGRAPATAPVPSFDNDPLRQWARRTVERLKSNLFGGKLHFLPYLDNDTEETQEIRNAYPAMLKEAVVKSGFLTKTLAVAAQEIQINPENPENQRERDGADFIRHCLKSIKGGTFSLAWNILSGTLVRGWNVCEQVEEVETKGRFAGKWVPRAIKAKDKVELLVDEFKNVTGIRSTVDRAVYDPAEFVVTQYLGLYSNPLGMSDFRAAYRPYWIKDTLWKLRGLHLEKFSAGAYLKGTYADTDQKAALEAALEEAKSQTWVSVPVGCLVEVIDLSGKGTSDFKSAMDDCDKEMLIAIVGAYLQILEGTVSDGRGDTRVAKDTSELFQWMLSALLAQVLNEQLIPEWIETNYMGLTPPVATLGSVNDAALASSLVIDEGLQRMGWKHGRKKIGNFYAREWSDDPKDVLTPPAAAGFGFGLPASPGLPSLSAPTSAPAGEAPADTGLTGDIAAAGDVQGTALNGAQIASLLEIILQLSTKQLPPTAAKEIILAAFPLMDPVRIEKIIGSLSKFQPLPPSDQPAETFAEGDDSRPFSPSWETAP